MLAGIDLSGRRAIVTGASSGIGIETARALAREQMGSSACRYGYVLGRSSFLFAG